MSRAFLVVLDSVGCGGAPDAAKFGDEGANTLGHIAQKCAAGDANEGRNGPLDVAFLDRLGLGAAIELASGLKAPGLDAVPEGLWGAATEISNGKDTPSGHWELAGVPVPWDWHYFSTATPSFPEDIVAEICEIAQVDGILGNCAASGTEIIERLGEEHLRTGQPICYTSTDSVLQIAAHEEVFGLERLLHLCKSIAPRLHDMRVGRVIARPFLGRMSQDFERTPNRKDYAMATPEATLLDWVAAEGRKTYTIGKISDIFSGRGVSASVKGPDPDLMDHLGEHFDTAEDGSLTFANFVEFDTRFGHRRDVAGYARHLEWFSVKLSEILPGLRAGDLLILTADHGNDPTWRGTDHTRERVPVLGWGYGLKPIGQVGFVDVAASIAHHLGVPNQGPGRSFL